MRFHKKVFIDLLIKMLGFGTFVGIIFPFFALLFGIDTNIALSALFIISCIGAGIMVGLISFLIVKSSVKKRLLHHIDMMTEVDKSILIYKESGFTDSIVLDDFIIKEDSDDCFGHMASAFNTMVNSLIDTLRFQKGHRQYIEDLSENLDLDQLSNFALKILMDLSSCSSSALLIEKDGELVVSHSHGIKNPENLPDNKVIYTVLKDSSRKIIDLPGDVIIDGVLTEYRPRQIVIEPIVYNSINTGILILASSDVIRSDFLEQLDIFMKSFSVILNNALQHERMQKLAAIDPLTGVYNRRFGMNRLTEECSRTIRFDSPLGLIMFDIDHFKMVNDTYGHTAGDRVLKKVVNEAQKVLRNGDVLVRYGGEEFMVILPGANKENVFNVSERIRYAVSQAITQYGDNQIKVTVSLGIDSYPESSMNEPSDLIKNADKALYTAKNSGRNKSVIF